jgi:hypothetical protein
MRTYVAQYLTMLCERHTFCIGTNWILVWCGARSVQIACFRVPVQHLVEVNYGDHRNHIQVTRSFSAHSNHVLPCRSDTQYIAKFETKLA